MAQLTNSPLQSVTFDLERRKSYSFNLNLTYKDGGGVDLTGCVVRFIVRDGVEEFRVGLLGRLSWLSWFSRLGRFAVIEEEGDPFQYSTGE